MRTKALLGTTVVALTVVLSACSTGGDAAEEPMTTPTASQEEPMASPSASQDESMTDASMMALTGTFAGLNDKSVAGTFMIEGTTITLEGFSSDEGPDLHLYLANGTDEASVDAGVELGTVVWDEASQTFELGDADASGFSHLVVHCDKANATFGAATLG